MGYFCDGWSYLKKSELNFAKIFKFSLLTAPVHWGAFLKTAKEPGKNIGSNLYFTKSKLFFLLVAKKQSFCYYYVGSPSVHAVAKIAKVLGQRILDT